MKTTDSVKEKFIKWLAEESGEPEHLIMLMQSVYINPESMFKFYSHSLAEARREGEELGFEMGEKSRVETIKKMQTMEGRWLQAVLEVGGQKLADKVLHAKSWTKSDLLTGDNPERKGK